MPIFFSGNKGIGTLPTTPTHTLEGLMYEKKGAAEYLFLLLHLLLLIVDIGKMNTIPRPIFLETY